MIKCAVCGKETDTIKWCEDMIYICSSECLEKHDRLKDLIVD